MTFSSVNSFHIRYLAGEYVGVGKKDFIHVYKGIFGLKIIYHISWTKQVDLSFMTETTRNTNVNL